MDATKPSRGPVLATGLATMAGWYGVLGAVAVLWWFSLSDTPAGEECQTFGCGWTARDVAVLAALFIGIPAFAASVLVSVAVVGGLAAARLRSGVLVGTVGAVAGWLAAVVVAVAYLMSAIHGCPRYGRTRGSVADMRRDGFLPAARRGRPIDTVHVNRHRRRPGPPRPGRAGQRHRELRAR
ncbi:hypothetical protein AB0K00_06370 [Dactylosporangium sp. NPDC049525]|uniref:hypothetical protein n=1 Tax=Dactylosporangium sp. NPDC049525 TaxID=3154730 RepID=UPI0034168DDE